MIRKLLPLLLVLPAANGRAEGHAVAIKLGALGLGAEYTYQLNDRVAFRGGLYGSQLGFDADESGIRYEFDVVWDSVAAGVDFHPLKTALRLSAGVLRNDNGLRALSRPAGNTTIGGSTYTPSEIGTLTGRVGFDKTAPFAGIGWDWSRDKRLFGMSLDIGLLDQGQPTVSLRGTGSLLGDPAFQQDIAAEEAELRDSLGGDLDVVPYLTVGFVFRF